MHRVVVGAWQSGQLNYIIMHLPVQYSVSILSDITKHNNLTHTNIVVIECVSDRQKRTFSESSKCFNNSHYFWFSLDFSAWQKNHNALQSFLFTDTYINSPPRSISDSSLGSFWPDLTSRPFTVWAAQSRNYCDWGWEISEVPLQAF